jgi:hypothetical protein
VCEKRCVKIYSFIPFPPKTKTAPRTACFVQNGQIRNATVKINKLL